MDRAEIPFDQQSPAPDTVPVPTVLFVGNAQAADFRAAFATTHNLARVHLAADLDEARALVHTGILPDLIVLAQEWPGQFSPEQVDALRLAAPLAPIVVLAGPWCEGETRSGRQLPGTTRLRAGQAAARLEEDLRRLRDAHCPSFALPATATEEERFLAACEQPSTSAGGILAGCTPDQEMWELLSRFASCAGWTPLRVQFELSECSQSGPSPGGHLAGVHLANVAAAVFDGADLSAGEARALAHLHAATAPAPVVALLSFPRQCQIDEARLLGAAAVLSKPLMLDDLHVALMKTTALK